MLAIRLLTIERYRRLGPKCAAVRMAEIAPGIVAVEDKHDECDAIFDRSVWQFNVPGAWESKNRGKEDVWLQEHELGILPGTGGFLSGADPLVNTIEKMAIYARRHLFPLHGDTWYDKPRFFKRGPRKHLT